MVNGISHDPYLAFLARSGSSQDASYLNKANPKMSCEPGTGLWYSQQSSGRLAAAKLRFPRLCLQRIGSDDGQYHRS